MRPTLISKGLMLLGAAIIVTLIVIGTMGDVGPEGNGGAVSPPPVNSQPNSQQWELQRCQSLGEAATQDASCLALWAETRRRFLIPASPTGVGD
jgi:conjugative transfer region protein TrbK